MDFCPGNTVTLVFFKTFIRSTRLLKFSQKPLRAHKKISIMNSGARMVYSGIGPLQNRSSIFQTPVKNLLVLVPQICNFFRPPTPCYLTLKRVDKNKYGCHKFIAVFWMLLLNKEELVFSAINDSNINNFPTVFVV